MSLKASRRVILKSLALLPFAGTAAFVWFLFGADHGPGLKLETGGFFACR